VAGEWLASGCGVAGEEPRSICKKTKTVVLLRSLDGADLGGEISASSSFAGGRHERL